jgi:hypothetical protein
MGRIGLMPAHKVHAWVHLTRETSKRTAVAGFDGELFRHDTSDTTLTIST